MAQEKPNNQHKTAGEPLGGEGAPSQGDTGEARGRQRSVVQRLRAIGIAARQGTKLLAELLAACTPLGMSSEVKCRTGMLVSGVYVCAAGTVGRHHLSPHQTSDVA